MEAFILLIFMEVDLKHKIVNGKFSFVQTGILLLILAIVLFVISFDTVFINLIKSDYLNDLEYDDMYEGKIVTINMDKSLGVAYYDSTVGITKQLYEGAKEYGRGYLVTIDDSFFTIETSSKYYSNLLNDRTLVKSKIIKGKLHSLDNYRIINDIGLLTIENGYDPNIATEKLIPYYIVVNNSVDDFVMFFAGIILSISGLWLLIYWSKNKTDLNKKNFDTNKNRQKNM